MAGRHPSLRDVSDEDHRAAFEHCSNFDSFARLRDNDPDLEEERFILSKVLRLQDACNFTESAWELLGRYLAQNDYVDEYDFSGGKMNDSKMAALCRGLTSSRVMKTLRLHHNDSLGMAGIRHAVPLLQNSSIVTLYLTGNRRIKTECFELLVNALGGGSIERLNLDLCSIKSIAALGSCSLPNLRELRLDQNRIKELPALDENCELSNLRYLSLFNNKLSQIQSLEGYTQLEHLTLQENKIGEAGFQAVANLLQNEESAMNRIDLGYTGLGDNEAEIIAASLRCNTKLRKLEIGWGNNFGENGLVFFSKLLNDISSIDRTANSNHVLTSLGLARMYQKFDEVEFALSINSRHQNNSELAGRAKVVETQLNSRMRMEFSQWQGVEYVERTEDLFLDVDPNFLPNVLALVGEKCGQDDLYHTIIATAPNLMSLLDRKTVLKNTMTKNSDRMAALAAELASLKELNSRLEMRLLSIESDEKKQPEEQRRLSGRKRERDG